MSEGDKLTEIAPTGAIVPGQGLLMKAASFVRESVIEPVGATGSRAASFVRETVRDPVEASYQAATFVRESVLEPVGTTGSKAASFVKETVLNPVEAGTKAATFVRETVRDTVETVEVTGTNAASFVRETVMNPVEAGAKAATMVRTNVLDPVLNTTPLNSGRGSGPLSDVNYGLASFTNSKGDHFDARQAPPKRILQTSPRILPKTRPRRAADVCSQPFHGTWRASRAGWCGPTRPSPTQISGAPRRRPLKRHPRGGTTSRTKPPPPRARGARRQKRRGRPRRAHPAGRGVLRCQGCRRRRRRLCCIFPSRRRRPAAPSLSPTPMHNRQARPFRLTRVGRPGPITRQSCRPGQGRLVPRRALVISSQPFHARASSGCHLPPYPRPA